MKYKKQIDPELRQIAKRIPYNKVIIRLANIFQTISFQLAKIPEGLTHKSFAINGYQRKKVNVDVFEPSNAAEKLPALIYVHGGAFSYKASTYHKKLACMYAARAKCKVYFPDYHLLPKYPYPAAYEDILALYKHIIKHSEEFGIDVKRIGVAGDSAGAAIAALLCNRYEREGLECPCLQMLVYPLTDIEMRTDSMKRFSDTPLWNSKNNKRMWSYYCQGLGAEAAYQASPMHSSLPQVIPDTYIETAEYDCLRDEGILYAKRLKEAGANVEINETLRTIHGYDSARKAQVAIKNIEKRISFLLNYFYTRGHGLTGSGGYHFSVGVDILTESAGEA